jgi:hypothetical protein
MQANPGEAFPFTLQTGWFTDTKRVFGQEYTFYLYCADGVTSFAPGLPGPTVASNLPELFNENGLTYDSQDRPSGRGDNIQVRLNANSAFIEGIAPNPLSSLIALPQTLSDQIEGLYWEGSRLNDTFTLSINTSSPTIQSIWYFGHQGNDVFSLTGEARAFLSQRRDPGLPGNLFWGGEGDDTLRLPGNSNEWVIDRDSDLNGLIISLAEDPSANFSARSVETVITDDKTFFFNSDGTPRAPESPSSPTTPGAPSSPGRRRSPSAPGAPNNPGGNPGNGGRRRGPSAPRTNSAELATEPEAIALEVNADSLGQGFAQALETAPDFITNFNTISEKINGLIPEQGNALQPLRFYQAPTNSTSTTLDALSASVFSDANGIIDGEQPLGAREATLVIATDPAIEGIYFMVNDDFAARNLNSDLIIKITGL